MTLSGRRAVTSVGCVLLAGEVPPLEDPQSWTVVTEADEEVVLLRELPEAEVRDAWGSVS